MRNQYLVKTACPSSSGTLRPEPCAGVSVKHIERAGLLAVALGATVVLATGCSSTGTGFGARLINPVPNKQPATLLKTTVGTNHRGVLDLILIAAE